MGSKAVRPTDAERRLSTFWETESATPLGLVFRLVLFSRAEAVFAAPQAPSNGDAHENFTAAKRAVS